MCIGKKSVIKILPHIKSREMNGLFGFLFYDASFLSLVGVEILGIRYTNMGTMGRAKYDLKIKHLSCFCFLDAERRTYGRKYEQTTK